MGVSSRLLNSPLRPFLRLMLPLGWKLAGFEPESTDTYEAATHETGQVDFEQVSQVRLLLTFCLWFR